MWRTMPSGSEGTGDAVQGRPPIGGGSGDGSTWGLRPATAAATASALPRISPTVSASTLCSCNGRWKAERI